MHQLFDVGIGIEKTLLSRPFQQAFHGRTLDGVADDCVVVVVGSAVCPMGSLGCRNSRTQTRRAIRKTVQVIAVVFAEFQQAARTLRVRRILAVSLARVTILR